MEPENTHTYLECAHSKVACRLMTHQSRTLRLPRSAQCVKNITKEIDVSSGRHTSPNLHSGVPLGTTHWMGQSRMPWSAGVTPDAEVPVAVTCTCGAACLEHF